MTLKEGLDQMIKILYANETKLRVALPAGWLVPLFVALALATLAAFFARAGF